jgi:hypothetical protein
MGRPREVTEENLLESFKANYVLGPEGCWLWIGYLDKDGYGRVQWAVLGVASQKAHRLSWKLFRGPLADDELVLHHCDVPSCVNPDHLFIGDHQINADDRDAKGRQSKGETHSSAKLTEAQVIAIINDPRTQYEIARDYNVSRVVVAHIKKGKSWKHLGVPREEGLDNRLKLSQEQAIAIINDPRTTPAIARDYGVAPNTVSRIKTGERWKHLDTYRNKVSR